MVSSHKGQTLSLGAYLTQCQQKWKMAGLYGRDSYGGRSFSATTVITPSPFRSKVGLHPMQHRVVSRLSGPITQSSTGHIMRSIVKLGTLSNLPLARAIGVEILLSIAKNVKHCSN
ncbi:hypothetical protein TCAL_15847 [Tigriopus californicus]|uniref:Uncharacterized protein n=1 Tax=Tigriopus californicus TaxID=6832 RepID=A0A553NP51_TIGCA|nr:hypothetical protein TCAL_15847 [Tigriopus californicus]